MFEYLIPHKAENVTGKLIDISKTNCFGKVFLNEIIEAEKILRFSLPEQLKIFYQEIGCGNLTAPHNCPADYIFYGANEILDPITVANFATDELFWDDQRNYISEDVCEELQHGDIPFFEIGDSSSFLKMKALSDNPNAVWDTYESDTYKAKIADSLEEFIYRLYYESTYYYEDIIAAEILEMKKRQKAQQ